jgi:D-alanyl-D-alanine-carboxypeptidase/D-alanyl-D-alanine-endopeptidase
MTKAHFRFACACAVVALLATKIAAAGLLPERVFKAAQERIDAGEYPALVIGYVDGDKSEVDTFGKLDDGKAPDADTVFEIGSITKTFTATLLAEAVQSGTLKLDTPVASLLPEFKIPSRNGKRITLGDIATQHSGLPRLPGNFEPADPGNPYADYDEANLKAFLAGYELPRDPGASYEYSNLAFGVLGLALAQHAHLTYGALLQQKILRPLGMSMSGVVFDANMLTHLARGHTENGKEAKNWDLNVFAGAGAIRSTTNDMMKYLEANIGAGSTALGAAIKLAQQPRRDVGNGARIGLAWMTRAAEPSSVVWHNGGTGGYRSFLGFSADGRHGIVILANSANGVDDLGFAALIGDAPLAPTHKAIALDAAALEDYVGVYRLRDDFLITIMRQDDQLFARATGQGGLPMYPSAVNEFFVRGTNIRMTFNRDAQGKVSGFVNHQNGDSSLVKLSAREAAAVTQSTQLDSAMLHDYIGKYQFGPSVVFDVTLKDDQLYTQLTGQPAIPVFASAKDKFHPAIVDAQIDFERDAGGKVVALTLHQNGHDQRAARIKP